MATAGGGRRRRRDARLRARTPGLVVLDVGMPEMDGLEVCRQIRRTSDVPILFLSARDEEIDRILGLEMGGDDYVTKPFSPRELVARVNVILRRARAAAGEATRLRRRSRMAGCRSIRQAARRRFGERALGLTAIEFAILKSLLARPGACAQPRQLMRRQPCRQHPYLRPHHRQPHPQHPRQARGGRRGRRDRDRARRRLQARAMRRVSGERKGSKWRPRIGLVVLAILLTVMALPLVGLFFFRIYENQLVRQTEAELIGQGAAIAAIYAREVREAGLPPEKLGAAVAGRARPQRQQRRRRRRPLPADRAQPRPRRRRRRSEPRPDSAAGDARSGLCSDRRAACRRARRDAADHAGRVPAARPGRRGDRRRRAMSAARSPQVEEVRAALAGSYASALRERVTERPAPPLYSVSRGTGVRVFVALPVVVEGRVAGAVYLSRTPNNIVKHLYGERGKVMLAAISHPRRHVADRLRLGAHHQPADARADRAHPSHRRRRPRRDAPARAATAPAKWPSCRRPSSTWRSKLQARSDTLQHLRHPRLARAEIAADRDPGRGRAAARRRRRHGAGQAHALLRQHHRRRRPAQPAGAPADRAGARRKLAISATRPRRSPRRWQLLPADDRLAVDARRRRRDCGSGCRRRTRRSRLPT